MCLQSDVTYSEHIVHYTTNNNHTGQSTSHWRLYLSSDKFGLETTENRFVWHKALAERIGRAHVMRGFGAGNENGVKRRVPLFSENIPIYIAKRFKEQHAIVFVYFSPVFQFV